jgi:PBP1b-binding outer membrane lipoprotein LpoB
MRHLLLVAVAILLASCSPGGNKPRSASPAPEQAAAQPEAPHEAVAAETHVEMVNVNIHLDSELILHIRHLAEGTAAHFRRQALLYCRDRFR